MKYLTIAFHASNLKRKKRGVVVDGIREDTESRRWKKKGLGSTEKIEKSEARRVSK